MATHIFTLTSKNMHTVRGVVCSRCHKHFNIGEIIVSKISGKKSYNRAKRYHKNPCYEGLYI